jgi:hypothetical protein
VWRLDLEIAPRAEVGERARHLYMTHTSGASLCSPAPTLLTSTKQKLRRRRWGVEVTLAVGAERLVTTVMTLCAIPCVARVV